MNLTDFFPLGVLLREQKIRAERYKWIELNANTCLSPKKACDISPLEHQASGILEYFSLPGDISLPLNNIWDP